MAKYSRAELTQAYWGIPDIQGEPGDYPLPRLRYYIREAEPGLRWSLEAPYQRGDVWTDKQQSEYVASFIAGGMAPPGPPVILNVPGIRDVSRVSANTPTWVLDGKQRLTALLRFLDGEITANVGGLIGEVHVDQVHTSSYLIRTIAVDLNLKDQVRFYCKLNSGVPHSTADLDFARKLAEESYDV